MGSSVVARILAPPVCAGTTLASSGVRASPARRLSEQIGIEVTGRPSSDTCRRPRTGARTAACPAVTPAALALSNPEGGPPRPRSPGGPGGEVARPPEPAATGQDPADKPDNVLRPGGSEPQEVTRGGGGAARGNDGLPCAFGPRPNFFSGPSLGGERGFRWGPRYPCAAVGATQSVRRIDSVQLRPDVRGGPTRIPRRQEDLGSYPGSTCPEKSSVGVCRASNADGPRVTSDPGPDRPQATSSGHVRCRAFPVDQ